MEPKCRIQNKCTLTVASSFCHLGMDTGLVTLRITSRVTLIKSLSQSHGRELDQSPRLQTGHLFAEPSYYNKIKAYSKMQR